MTFSFIYRCVTRRAQANVNISGREGIGMTDHDVLVVGETVDPGIKGNKFDFENKNVGLNIDGALKIL